ncbi:MAG: heme exporter protein CcmB [Gammaproteobacteria bacterium]|nr:MAG: heme exporter protein CcmB [Gammaproteobacteria bacterium]
MKTFLKKEWLLAIRQPHDLFQPLFFVMVLITLFPLALGIDELLLQKIVPGIIWIAVLLSILLASEKCYQSDFDDGSLEQLLLSGHNPLLLIAAKATIQWMVRIVPLLAALPILGVFYNLPSHTIQQLALTLVIGTPSLILLGMLGSAVTLSVTRGSMLLILVVLPLYIPTLIFALSALSSYADGFSNTGQLAMLAAIFMTTLIVVPFAILGAIRASLAT